MAKSSKFEFESPSLTHDQEDEQTLAAIDEGLADVDAGRTVSAKEVRKRMPEWITASHTRKER